MSPSARFWAATIAANLLGVAFGWIEGNEHGVNVGYAVAHSEAAARVTEHDRIMRKVGLCAWAKIMADDIKCKQERP